MSECVWIWGKARGALDFFYRVRARGGEAFYAETWKECLSAMDESGRYGPVYGLPDETQCAQLPRFFRVLSKRSCYQVGIACPEARYWPLPEACFRQVEGVDFACFSFRQMPLAQRVLKRVFDIVASVSGFLLCSPLFLLCTVLVKAGSKGPVFYSQERIGKNGEPFRIYKFRSMRVDAEDSVPRLSHADDDRITRWGSLMRRFRLDELPQLYNALKGDMSVVGYRPERDYFIGKIEKQAPYYSLLFAIRPGISSLGITTCGYAEDVRQMVVRLGCDIDYLQRLSLREDGRILGRTVRVVLYGIGK